MRGLRRGDKKAGAGLYSEVLVTEALDTNPTVAGLDWIVERISAKINPPRMLGGNATAHDLPIANSGYIFIRMLLKERDLVAFFGEAHVQYRKRVSMIAPMPTRGDGLIAEGAAAGKARSIAFPVFHANDTHRARYL